MQGVSFIVRVFALSTGIAGICSFASGQPQVHFLPADSNGQFLMYGMSADGRFVVGQHGISRPFLWKIGSEPVDLPSPNGTGIGVALDVNADGTVVTGFCEGQYCLWTGTDVVEVIDVPGTVGAISGDGTQVVGSSSSGPYRWTCEGGVQWLQTPPDADAASPYAMSTDGSIAVGVAISSEYERAIAWNADGTYRWLDPVGTPTDVQSRATAVNADGSVIMGLYFDPDGARGAAPACRWIAGGPAQVIPDSYNFIPQGVTADGKRAILASSQRGKIWMADAGARTINSYLSAFGMGVGSVNLQGPTTFGDVGMAEDGSAIAGRGSGGILGAWGTWAITGLRPNIAPPAPCIGDADGDKVVAFADLAAVLATWGTTYSPETGPGDANGDGVVDFEDVTEVLGHFSYTCFGPPS